MNTDQVPPAAPAAHDFALAVSLVAIASDPDGARIRIEELRAAAAQVREAIDELKGEQAKLAAARQEHENSRRLLVEEREQQGRRLHEAKTRHDTECREQAERVKNMERDLIVRERQLVADRERVEALRADLEKRIAAIKAAAA